MNEQGVLVLGHSARLAFLLNAKSARVNPPVSLGNLISETSHSEQWCMQEPIVRLCKEIGGLG